jgi:hypothetical protein
MLENIREIDVSDFKRWVENPITRLLLENIEYRKASIINDLVNNESYSLETANKALWYKGILIAYKEFMNYDYESFDVLREMYLKEVENETKAN